jgi:hypothetical protein
MRRIQASVLATLAALASGACSDAITGTHSGNVAAPTNLTYQLQPSGDPAKPSGIILRWDNVTDPALATWNVYSRNSASAGFGLRGQTTSPSFHDDGVPALEYAVTAQDVGGVESPYSNSVIVDERLALQSPAALTSISLNGAIHLQWTDNAFTAQPGAFSYYRVYSTSYSLDSNLCGAAWTLEGTTISPEFLSSALTNGVPRCFGVSAIAVEGYESLWSPLRYDTPRPDARNLLVYTQAADPTKSGFRFWLDANANNRADAGELGLVLAGAGGNADFSLQASGSQLMLTPARAAVQVTQYGSTAVADLTSIDIAPATGYAATALQAQAGYGYVFQINPGDGFYRYGAIRVTAVGSNYVILDWSYQTDKGNPELIRMAGF